MNQHIKLTYLSALTIFFLLLPSITLAGKFETLVKDIPQIIPGPNAIHPKEMILGTFGEKLDISYSIAFAEEDLLFYAFPNNKNSNSIKLFFDISVFDSRGKQIGSSKSLPVTIKQNTKYQLIGVPIYKTGDNFKPLLRQDIEEVTQFIVSWTEE